MVKGLLRSVDTAHSLVPVGVQHGVGCVESLLGIVRVFPFRCPLYPTNDVRGVPASLVEPPVQGGRRGGRERGREGEREKGREGGREGGREKGREGGRKGGREGEREGGREKGREGGREGGRKGRRAAIKEFRQRSNRYTRSDCPWITPCHVLEHRFASSCLTRSKRGFTGLPLLVSLLRLQSLDLGLEVVQLLLDAVLAHLCPGQLLLQHVVAVSLQAVASTKEFVVLKQSGVCECVCVVRCVCCEVCVCVCVVKCVCVCVCVCVHVHVSKPTFLLQSICHT